MNRRGYKVAILLLMTLIIMSPVCVHGVQDLVLQVKHQGTASAFAWVLPPPSKPKVQAVEAVATMGSRRSKTATAFVCATVALLPSQRLDGAATKETAPPMLGPISITKVEHHGDSVAVHVLDAKGDRFRLHFQYGRDSQTHSRIYFTERYMTQIVPGGSHLEETLVGLLNQWLDRQYTPAEQDKLLEKTKIEGLRDVDLWAKRILSAIEGQRRTARAKRWVDNNYTRAEQLELLDRPSNQGLNKKDSMAWSYVRSWAADYELAIRDFGTSRGDPIDSSYVFFHGKYIEAPYVVERRGLSIYINNVMVSGGARWPMLNRPVHKDPGDPPPGCKTRGRR